MIRKKDWKDLLLVMKRSETWKKLKEYGVRAVLKGKGFVLKGVNLSGADLEGADLSYSDLSGADLSDAVLCDADLSHADLRETNFRGADLSGANLSNSNLSGADISHATYCAWIIEGVTCDRVVDGRLIEFRNSNGFFDFLRKDELMYCCGPVVDDAEYKSNTPPIADPEWETCLEKGEVIEDYTYKGYRVLIIHVPVPTGLYHYKYRMFLYEEEGTSRPQLACNLEKELESGAFFSAGILFWTVTL